MARTLDTDGLDGLIPAPPAATAAPSPAPTAPPAAPAPPAAQAPVAAPDLPPPAPAAAKPPARRGWAVAVAALAVVAAVILVFAFNAWREQETASIAPAPDSPAAPPAVAAAAKVESPSPAAAPAPDSPAAHPAVAAAAKVEPPLPAAVPAGKEPGAGASADLIKGTRFPGTYGLNTTAPTDWTVAEVRAVAAALQRCAGQIDVTGHTCALGSLALNQRVGLLRAKAVKRILVARGVDGERIRVRSAGSTEPLESNKSADGRRLNRRVTVSCHAP